MSLGTPAAFASMARATWSGSASSCALKDTGMALDDIIRYAELRECGDTTLAARQALLEQHAARLHERIQRDHQHLDALQAKIALYRQQTSA